ncbi:hypothetical protein GGR50DRAFT_701436 [Xylaria sp. CBS 124048]|nr:hypothetical protein GGR50DRAFT_701436 [Xylaria sp. CBS 124048]
MPANTRSMTKARDERTPSSSASPLRVVTPDRGVTPSAPPAQSTGLTPSVARATLGPGSYTIVGGIPQPNFGDRAHPRPDLNARSGEAQPEPPRPRRRAPPPRVSGEVRDPPCLRCVRSALRGRSNGVCEETVGRGARCFRCAHGHKCEVTPPVVAPAASALRDALVRGASQATVDKLRTTVRTMLSLAGIEEED